ncbi:unnamed protein product [Urochloa decumbens]|uniref:Cullin family profile domain-containing protein n=1 Tax=Urochloa decumbens TaxID=240449 RepID=A0ABC9F1G8_9POAL
MKAIKNLEIYQRGNLSTYRFYVGYNELPVDYLEIISDDICQGHHYLQVSNSLGVRALKDDITPDIETTLDHLSTQLLLAIAELAKYKIQCVHLDTHRAMADLIAKGRSSAVFKAMDDALAERYSELRVQMQDLDNHEMLQRIFDSWALERDFLVQCKKFFCLLDSERPGSILKLGQGRWVSEIILSPALAMLDKVFGLVDLDREGASLERFILTNMVGMLKGFGGSIYKDRFESRFLEGAFVHYQGEHHRLSQSLSGADLLKALHTLLSGEIDRTSLYVTGESRQKLMGVLGNVILADRLEWIKSYLVRKSDEVDLCMDKHLNEIAKIYAFFENSLHGHSMLVACIRNCYDSTLSILTEGANTCQDPELLIAAIINFKKNAHMFNDTALKNNSGFSEQLNSSLSDLLNSTKFYPEFLSLYVDARLREAARGYNLYDALDSAVDLVQLLNDKDVFELYHRKHLSLRIVSGSVDDATEQKFLLMLQGLDIGVFKPRRILRDFKESAKTMTNFELCSSMPSVTVNVFCSDAWPKLSCTTGKLPSDIAEVCDQFEKHYCKSKNHARRQLSWQANEGHAVVTGNFGGKSYDLEVSTHEMCILMLFNTEEYLSFDNIKETTKIPDLDLVKSLASLCTRNVLQSLVVDAFSKSLVVDTPAMVTLSVQTDMAPVAVTLSPKTDDALAAVNGEDGHEDEQVSASRDNEHVTVSLMVKEDEAPVTVTLTAKTVEIFFVNDSFIHTSDQIQIYECIARREPEQEKAVTLHSVKINRDPQIDAAIGRIMKKRKRMNHVDLVSSVIEQVQEFFQPDHADIKRCIENLIEQDLIERNRKNPQMYRYVE